MGSKPLNTEESQQYKTEEYRVEEVGTSNTSLEEEYAAALETLNESSSKSSIKSKASKTSVKSKMGSAVSLSSGGDDSPMVCRIHVYLDVKCLNVKFHIIYDGTPSHSRQQNTKLKNVK